MLQLPEREEASGKLCQLLSHLEVTHVTSAHILLAKARLEAILHFQWAAEGRQQYAECRER